MLLYRVDMYADDEDHAVITLSTEEERVVRNFLTQVREETKGHQSWAGGIWELAGPFATEEDAWNLSLM